MASVTSKKTASQFEKGRIEALKEERIKIQKKTFTKWINSFLDKVNLHVTNLFVDLQDGKRLLKLLEIISGEKLGRVNKGTLRVMKMENVGKALRFLSSKVRLESIGAEDIVDGNPRLTLGLIWTIILRFQIQDIHIEEEGAETKSAKEALLLWCQRKTAGYPGVNITNFTTSWRSGLAFNALIHAHRPEMINFESLKHNSNEHNLNNAFDVAYSQLGIAKLLDAEDVDVAKPDEKSVMTYVAAYYHCFAKMKSEQTGGKRIAKIVGQLMEVDQLQHEYEDLVSNLLEWIHNKTTQLKDHKFPNSLDGIQHKMQDFKQYRTEEKPPKYVERGNIEATYFNIQTKIRAQRMRPYQPSEGKLTSDIEKAWGKLEKAEHDRELALRRELARQEKLERLAEKFNRKALLRESWVDDMTTVLQESVIPSSNYQAVDAATKRHEAITADVMARKDRFVDLSNMCRELMKERYHSCDGLHKKEKEISRNWQELMDLLGNRQQVLQGFSDLMGMFREIESITAEMKDIEVGLQSEDTGKQLLGVRDLIQRHALVETQIKTQGRRVSDVNKKAESYVKGKHPESKTITKRVAKLNMEYQNIAKSSQERKAQLGESRKYFQFLQDSEEEESWLMEKQRIAKSMVTGRDLRSVISTQQKHAALELGITARQQIIEEVINDGEDLVAGKHKAKKRIQEKIEDLKQKWEKLNEYAEARRIRLEEASQSHQYYIDANEAESWMRAKMPLVCSDDYGKDPTSAKSLLQKHLTLEEEIQAYQSDIKKLNQQARQMIDANLANQAQLKAVEEQLSPSKEDEYITELVDVPYEVEEERIVEKEEMREEIIEKRYPQVKAVFAYSGHGMKVTKGEIMILIEKTNAEWWSVRTGKGTEGFVPANYVKDTRPKIVKKKVQKKVKVPKKVKVTKTLTRQEEIRKKRKRNTSLSRMPSLRRERTLHFDRENVELRQQGIDGTYRRLQKLALARKRYLNDAIKLFTFYRECDEFEVWMKEKEKIMKKKETLSERVEATRRKFENLLTDLAANQSRVERINKMADAFVETGHSKQADVRKRQKEINMMWERLQKMKEDKEKMLEGASSIELYNHSWGETKEWIMDKMHSLLSDNAGHDPTSVEALQRKHEIIERELAPVEDKLRKLGLLAKAVKTSYPNEGEHITHRQDEIQDLWDKLEDKAEARKTQLAQSRDTNKFHSDAKDLLNWCNEVKGKLMDTELARGVPASEQLLKDHQEVLEDIKTHQDKFTALDKLGKDIMKVLPESVTIAHKVKKMAHMQQELLNGWDRRNKQLEDSLDLALFNREADHIDATTSGHEAFLEFDDLGGTVDSVGNLMKRHEDFENTLIVQEERLQGLDDMAGKLIIAGHYSKDFIRQRCDEVLERRRKVRERSNMRQHKLLESKDYLEFCRDANELSTWITEKLQIATDESYRELANVEGKLKKHQAFEAQLTAHKDSLQKVNEAGRILTSSKNFKSDEIETELASLNKRWDDLTDHSDDKGNKLRQAVKEHQLNRALEDMEENIDEMEKILASEDVGSDLRSVKDLLKNQQLMENEMSVQADKVNQIVEQAHQITEEGHFDVERIAIRTAAITERFAKLGEPAKKQRGKLEDSHKLQKFIHDINGEMQWIKEHLPAASSTDYGKNLTATQSLLAKHKKLKAELTGHQPVIDKAMKAGQSLIDSHHFACQTVQDHCQELSIAWDQLLDVANERGNALQISFETQQFFTEVGEAEVWIAEKMALVSSTDYGKDEDATEKLTTKNKALEMEIDNYYSMIESLHESAQNMLNKDVPRSQEIAAKQEIIQDRLTELNTRAGLRSDELERTKLLHAYVRESDELGEWIEEQYQVASSSDFGQDYEHLQILQGKFDEFRRKAESGRDQFNRCESQAQELIQSHHPFAGSMQEKQDSLKEALEMLNNQIQLRAQRLDAAGEIHKFNRDVDDAMSRIQEKYNTIPEDLGKDVNTAQSLTRKHEAFENDLMALENQLQSLVNDATELQEAYPGENAEHIASQQEAIVSNWNLLQAKSADRKGALQAAQDYHKLLAACRDLINWASETNSEMAFEETIRDVTSATDARSQHQQYRVEIDTREDNFASLVQAGEMLITQDHYAKDEIQEKLEAVLHAREELHTNWQNKNDYLVQVFDQQVFMRDAKQLETLSSQQEVYLSGGDLGSTVEEVDGFIKKHEAFEKLLATQEEKTALLKDYGKKLISKGNFDSENIQKKLDEVLQRRSKVKAASDERKEKLTTTKQYAQFNRNVAEAKTWIDEKMKIMGDDLLQDMNLEDKMKKLQKHQAFEAEILANEELIVAVQRTSEELVHKQHQDSDDINNCGSDLLGHWKKLRDTSEQRSKHLEEVRDLLEFNRQAEKAEAWIREKELMMSAGELGRDYEHCLELQKKLNDIGTDMSVDDSVIQQINDIGDKLIRQGQGKNTDVDKRKQDITHNWQAMQNGLSHYRNKIESALEVHTFNRDVDEVKERLSEKRNAMCSEEFGKDLNGVESLQRRHQDMIRDISAIEDRLKELDEEESNLCRKHPENEEQIYAKKLEATQLWEALKRQTKQRKTKLDDSYNLQKFYKDYREMNTWSNDVVTRMTSGDLAKSVAEAENMCEFHKERKVEIDGRDAMFKYVRQFGDRLVQRGHYASDDIKKSIQHTRELRQQVHDTWEERKDLLAQCFDFQVFQEYVEQAETWLATKEAFLTNDDVGETLTSVESLFRKQDGFEKTLQTQVEKIEDLQTFASELVQAKHYDTKNIEDKCKAVLERKEKLWAASEQRRQTLAESKQLHQFLQNHYEVYSWIQEKMQIASDESYKDPSNLKGKMQKHQAFEAELSANKGRVEAVIEEGERMVAASHFASEDVKAKLDDLNVRWEELLSKSAYKRDKIKEAIQAKNLLRGVDDLTTWMCEVETQLGSQDLGKDLMSATKLLKKHQVLESQIIAHEERVHEVQKTADALKEANHFMSDEMMKKATEIVQRYEALSGPAQERKQKLDDARLLHQFYRDVADELSWIQEKQPMASSADLGKNLTAVQNLHKKHQALEAEIIAHEPLVDAVAVTAQKLIGNKHYASQDIVKQTQEMKDAWIKLKDDTTERKRKLLDAMESQMFYAEVIEAQSWMDDKRPLLASSDYGKDEDSAVSLLKKLDALDLDLEAFDTNMQKLSSLSSGLIERGHFDSEDIRHRQDEAEASYMELLDLSSQRRILLEQQKTLLEFYREVDEMVDWIKEREPTANSEDYGKDVEHIEVLQVRFNDFAQELLSNNDKISALLLKGHSLLPTHSQNADSIKARCHEVEFLWEQLKERTSARSQGLANAKIVHSFDRDADETKAWIMEKDTAVSSEDYGHDLASVQALVRRHEGFERDLAALEEQVECISNSAAELVELFPDAFEHISANNDTVVGAWNSLLEKAATRKDRLVQAEHLQTYFNDYREFSAWISEMMALITSDDPPHDVPSAEALLSRHMEHKAEIDGRADGLVQFTQTGLLLIKEGHFLSDEIKDKIEQLQTEWEDLIAAWDAKNTQCEAVLDSQLLTRDLDQAEAWLNSRTPLLKDDTFLDDSVDIEDMIKKHDDFEKMIAAQEEKFAALKRSTMSEEESEKKEKDIKDKVNEAMKDVGLEPPTLVIEDTDAGAQEEEEPVDDVDVGLMEEFEDDGGLMEDYDDDDMTDEERSALVAQIAEEMMEEELNQKIDEDMLQDDMLQDDMPQIHSTSPVVEEPVIEQVHTEEAATPSPPPHATEGNGNTRDDRGMSVTSTDSILSGEAAQELINDYNLDQNYNPEQDCFPDQEYIPDSESSEKSSTQFTGDEGGKESRGMSLISTDSALSGDVEEDRYQEESDPVDTPGNEHTLLDALMAMEGLSGDDNNLERFSDMRRLSDQDEDGFDEIEQTLIDDIITPEPVYSPNGNSELNAEPISYEQDGQTLVDDALTAEPMSSPNGNTEPNVEPIVYEQEHQTLVDDVRRTEPVSSTNGNSQPKVEIVVPEHQTLVDGVRSTKQVSSTNGKSKPKVEIVVYEEDEETKGKAVAALKQKLQTPYLVSPTQGVADDRYDMPLTTFGQPMPSKTPDTTKRRPQKRSSADQQSSSDQQSSPDQTSSPDLTTDSQEEDGSHRASPRLSPSDRFNIPLTTFGQSAVNRSSPAPSSDSPDDDVANQRSPRQGPTVKSRIEMFQTDPIMPPPQETATLRKRGKRSQIAYPSLPSDSDDSSCHRNQNNNWESRQLPVDYSSSDGLDSDGDISRKENTRKKPPTYCKPPVAPASPRSKVPSSPRSKVPSSPRSKVPSSPRSKVPVAKYSRSTPWSEDEGASSSSEMPSERRRKSSLRSRPNTPPPPPPPGQTPPGTPRSNASSPRVEISKPLTPLQKELHEYMASPGAFPTQPQRPAPPSPLTIGIIPATPPPTKRASRPQVHEVTATPPPPPAMHVIDFKGQVPPRIPPREQQREKKKFGMSLFKKK